MTCALNLLPSRLTDSFTTSFPSYFKANAVTCPEAPVLKLRCSRPPEFNGAKTKGIITTRRGCEFTVAGSSLWDIERQYTLNEVAIITPASPARILGLKDKGHPGRGADADITIYTPHENKEIMFEMPRVVIKSGQVLVQQREIRKTLIGKTLHVSPNYDNEVEPDIKEWFEKYYSIHYRNYSVDLSYLTESSIIPPRQF